MTPLPPGKVVGIRVREHRELHSLTQAQLAERLKTEFDWVIDRSMLARIESGERQVNVDELFKLAAILDTTPVLLLTPADESELMAPTPWRAMTSSRARAWITDEVRMREQDTDRYQVATDLAWRRSLEFHSEVGRLLSKIAALHGEERIEDVQVDTELAPKAAAAVAVLELQLELATQHHNWVTHVGPWDWPDPAERLALLESHPLFTEQAAISLFGRDPLAEIVDRHNEAKPPKITTGDGAADRVRGLVEHGLDVVDELAAAVRDRLASIPARRERPSTRSTGERPA
jgi:transcriptional regulator with XRE-family HTH domain